MAPDRADISDENSLSDISINIDMIIEHLNNLNISKGPGPDGMNGRILKEVTCQIAPMASHFAI